MGNIEDNFYIDYAVKLLRENGYKVIEPKKIGRPNGISKLLTKEDFIKIEENGLTYDLVYQRVKQGWTLDKALNTKIRKYNTLTIKEMQQLQKIGLSLSGFRSRLYQLGWTREQALNVPKSWNLTTYLEFCEKRGIKNGN